MNRKILFIMHMPPPVHGAAMVGQYIHDSAKINSTFDCRYVNIATASSIEDIGKVRLGKILDFLKLRRQIVSSIREDKPDLVYITPNSKGISFFKEYLLVKAIKRYKVEIIAHYHNKGVSEKQNNLLYNALYRRFFKNLKLILLSERLYGDVKKYVVKEDVYICPNGIPADVSQKHLSSVPHILFLSNLIPEKGVYVLLDSLKVLKDREYSFVCDFVGAETAQIDSKRFGREVSDRGIENMVIYHGGKYGAEKKAFLEMAAVFAFPSFYPGECFPLVLLEAMSYRIPVAATSVGGVPDMVEDGKTGFVCPPADSVSFADKLAELLDNKDLRENMGKAGYEKFLSEFTLDVWENRMVEIIESLHCTKA